MHARSTKQLSAGWRCCIRSTSGDREDVLVDPGDRPACAIAYWGIAISQRPNPLVGPIPPALL
jgi:hypothetical protein